MKIISRRVFQYACFGIAACAVVHPLAAQQSQQPRIAPAEIGQIVNEVLRVLVPPGDSLSGVSIAKRKVVFDYAQTMAAFGYPGAHTSLAALGIRMPVTAGSESLLNDCDNWGTKPCKQLGWRAYVSIEPISITNSQVVVRGYVNWPERRRTPFVEGVAPTGKASLAGFATQIYLARSANGEWKFVKKGYTIVG